MRLIPIFLPFLFMLVVAGGDGRVIKALNANVLVTVAQAQDVHGTEAERQIPDEVKAEVRATVENYVRSLQEARKPFQIQDPAGEVKGALSLKWVHDRVWRDTESTLAVCADFEDEGGNIVDLDFFMDRDEEGTLMVRRIRIHKVNDQPRK